MGLKRVDKLQSLTQTSTKPTQNGQCIIGTFLVLGRATSNSNSQDSPQLGLGGRHHLPPYIILCTSPRRPHPNGFLSRAEIPTIETHVILGAHNFTCRPPIAMQSKAKLQPSLRVFQQYVARLLHASKLGQFLTFNDHNLCFGCPNEQCKPILNI